ncbi:MAG: hypothetical protein D6791_14970 [Chloroflexi bacterium]|nr:MAG: hypothetical protein D6791_14970 [Chloroflexota bacterium]
MIELQPQEATMNVSPTSLISTLGTEPQVVTLALQALLRNQSLPDEVVVIHSTPDSSPIAAALARLAEAFANEVRALPWEGRYCTVEIREGPRPVYDMLTPDDFNAVMSCLYRVVRDRKAQGYRIHLNLAGGRKLMTIAAMTVAQLLFDDTDHLWYLQSAPELVASRQLFADNPDQATLIAVPLLRWSPTPPILTDVALTQDPMMALARQHEQMLRRKRRFLQETLTPAEREVVELLIRTGATDAELAARLHKSRYTVSRQLESVYAKLRQFLDMREDIRVDRATLIVQFRDVL